MRSWGIADLEQKLRIIELSSIGCQTIWQNSKMNDQTSNTNTQGPIQAIDQTESIQEVRDTLVKARKHLKFTPDDGNPVDRARALLDVAELQLGLGQGGDAWRHAREAFSVFVDYEH